MVLEFAESCLENNCDQCIMLDGVFCSCDCEKIILDQIELSNNLYDTNLNLFSSSIKGNC